MPTTPLITLSSPIGLLEKSLEIYRGHFKRLIGIILFTQLTAFISGFSLLFLGILVAFLAGAGNIFSSGLGERLTALVFVGVGVFLVCLIVGFLLFLFVSAWGGVALVLAVTTRNQPLPLGQLFKTTASRVLPYWWVMFLSGFLVLGGLSLLIIPGFLFALWFSQAMYIVILEGTGGMSALFKSREYMRDRLIAFLFRMIVFQIIWMTVFVLIDMFPLLTRLITGNESRIVSILSNSVSLIMTIILIPLSTIYYVLLYEELKAARGPFALTVTTGRKLKYLAVAVAGYIVFLILPFLLLIAVINPGRQMSMSMSRDATRRSDLVQIRSALEIYRSERKFYPYDLFELVPRYMPDVPKDPQHKFSFYSYQQLREGQGYELCARMERSERFCLHK